MRTLAFLTLTAAAIAVPTAAWAQPAPRAGHSWGQSGERVVVRHGPGAAGAHAPGMRRDHREYRRFGRGQVLPPQWAGPQFHVRQWQSYGFPQPMPGYRWVRYYDDAVLVDRRGRVHDSRESFDWDRYGDRWGRDDRGIPVYVGDGDYRPDGRDYAWAEEADDGWDYSEYGDVDDYRGADCGGGRDRGPCGPRGHSRGHGGSYSHGGSYGRGGYGAESGYGYSSGYSGYGYGYGGATMTITETIVESGGSSGSSYVVEEVIEEVVETRARARRAAPRRAAPVRRPIRGERG
jgi:Ni/Co efflux regulator RcnB